MGKVFFIMGCTACGKGAVGRELARRLGGRILSVDSMKIYRRMDIGTAKPAAEVRREIPHYGLDLVEPSENFTVADYVRIADEAVEECARGGAACLAVGGTSLYIKALSEGLFEAPAVDGGIRAALRKRAQTEGLGVLHAELRSLDPAAGERIHPNDERRILRALEVRHATGQPISELQRQWDAGALRHECVFIGLRRDKNDLNRRINLRVQRMVDAGLVNEVASLLDEPRGLSSQAAQAVGYAEIIAHLHGECSFGEAVEQVKINTRHLAKKQRTWHRRFAAAQWFDLAEAERVEQTVDRILAAVGFP
jgi:tRNA dimethylallyltransferase